APPPRRSRSATPHTGSRSRRSRRQPRSEASIRSRGGTISREVTETRRVLITGVSRFWGCQLAKRLEADPAIERIVAIDTAAPPIELTRTDFVRADIRHSLIGKLLHAIEIDTVVHAGLIVDPRRAAPRRVHETNVIGTMNLIAAC